MPKFAIETQTTEILEYVRKMAVLAEYHDKEVKHHIERVRGYTEIIAQGLNLTSQEVEFLSVASMLHDVGKIGIPVGLQVKVDKFDPFEWEIIKKHPVAKLMGVNAENLDDVFDETILETDLEDMPFSLKGKLDNFVINLL